MALAMDLIGLQSAAPLPLLLRMVLDQALVSP